ncbi:phosphoribosylamine--glycine ligase [Thiolinea disciformis]|uniref:phosphoribosylamine--glycine ligase n=1 Tax=Thiolinea disciformis TaxID=125614 RepID=UPI000373E486|nr:phosphoribosylamine--glycine ligase [Thiolinea disciformis]
MKILVVGSGGREHALAWKLAQSTRVTEVLVAPGNAGTALEAKVRNAQVAVDDVPALVQLAQIEQIDLTVIGPEVPLVKGVVDAFRAAGLRCFGPTQQAAQLEGSKAFAKDFLARHHIPTAFYGVFTDLNQAEAYIREKGAPIVIKADGLAAGKGVILAQTEAEALAAVRDMLAGNAFGDAGHRVVIEEFLHGEEASFIVMVDGKNILPMASSQDHKARDVGDTGPNTGGMGAYSPAPVVTPDMHERIMREVIEPTVKGMSVDGVPYTGFLYAGIMVDPQGVPKVLEFNCRFGDPETQPIMMRLQSDLVDLLEAALNKRLDKVQVQWDSRAALGVVLAAGGYPDAYRKGDVISGLEQAAQLAGKVFHAGTQLKDTQVVTQGGRVLCAVGLGHSVTEAQQQAYQLVKAIQWQDMYCRPDIGHRAIAREQSVGKV